ncbi:hypothetical protein BGX23_004953 [Mortierella sp. AD031]|nr:hypothetical protein BGX23_004953 [Mortierella sp. AD031]
MFARPVDPFFAYNSAFSAAERHHKEMMFVQQDLPSSQQDLGTQQPPHLNNNNNNNQSSSFMTNTPTKRRKRSLYFEPEFLSALTDQDPSPPVLSRPRPCKKFRCSTTTQSGKENHFIDSNTTNSSSFAQSTATPATVPGTLYSPANEHGSSSTTSPRFSSKKTTDGPSIIDLSSGEELVAMNVGQSDHKRPREPLHESSSSSSAESLREVYNVQEDGSISPVLDHAPALPSPAKRSRIDPSTSSDGSLMTVDELEEGRERKRLNRRSTAHTRHATDNAFNSTSNDIFGYRDEPMDYNGWMSDDECSNANNTRRITPKPEMALIRYEGPKTVTLADGVEALIRKRWNDDHDILALDNLQGNEMVLYRPPPPQALRDCYDNDNEPSSTIVEELDDDDTFQASHSHSSKYSTDNLIHELEDKIMDMDLD